MKEVSSTRNWVSEQRHPAASVHDWGTEHSNRRLQASRFAILQGEIGLVQSPGCSCMRMRMHMRMHAGGPVWRVYPLSRSKANKVLADGDISAPYRRPGMTCEQQSAAHRLLLGRFADAMLPSRWPAEDCHHLAGIFGRGRV